MAELLLPPPVACKRRGKSPGRTKLIFSISKVEITAETIKNMKKNNHDNLHGSGTEAGGKKNRGAEYFMNERSSSTRSFFLKKVFWVSTQTKSGEVQARGQGRALDDGAYLSGWGEGIDGRVIGVKPATLTK